MTRRNEMMAIVTIEDFTGSTEALFFKDEVEKFKELLIPDKMVVLSGTASTREEEPVKIRVTDIYSLAEARGNLTRIIQISINTAEFNQSKLMTLERLFQANPGDTKVVFRVRSQGKVLKLRSFKYSVSTDNEFIQDLENLLGPEGVRLN